MPTYGYHCPRCQTEFEVFQRMSDEPGADCPTCGSRGRRLYFPAGIVFKGSGFYKTDSRSSGARAESPSGKPSADRAVAPAAGEATRSAGDSPKGGTSAGSGGGTSSAGAATAAKGPGDAKG